VPPELALCVPRVLDDGDDGDKTPPGAQPTAPGTIHRPRRAPRSRGAAPEHEERAQRRASRGADAPRGDEGHHRVARRL